MTEQESSFRAKMHEAESLWLEKQKKEMELFKTELFLNLEKVKQAKQETEEELYKAIYFLFFYAEGLFYVF